MKNIIYISLFVSIHNTIFSMELGYQELKKAIETSNVLIATRDIKLLRTTQDLATLSSTIYNNRQNHLEYTEAIMNIGTTLAVTCIGITTFFEYFLLKKEKKIENETEENADITQNNDQQQKPPKIYYVYDTKTKAYKIYKAITYIGIFPPLAISAISYLLSFYYEAQVKNAEIIYNMIRCKN